MVVAGEGEEVLLVAVVGVDRMLNHLIGRPGFVISGNLPGTARLEINVILLMELLSYTDMEVPLGIQKLRILLLPLSIQSKREERL
ncbi:hypothetical protein Goshw_001305 [Gossypium schwendimanii]|uniref:Uncharacterized protein n=1 Tax=Gossypium schwendimanii TaxID=34291 RepID=A0A7J9LSS0_GOSSC|nr:hypothetical protein [Gossypium schwendimanii]